MSTRVPRYLACFAALSGTAFAAETALLGGPAGFAGVAWVPTNNVSARLTQQSDAASIKFEKTGNVRRMLALATKPAGALSPPRALALWGRVSLEQGEAPRLATVLFERGGGVWFRVSGTPLDLGESIETRMPLRSLREAGFSNDASGQLEWEQVEKVWVGLVMDGPARGTFELSRAIFTDEPYRPTRPLRIPRSGPGTWSVGKDAAVTATLTTPNEGPEGQACMKVAFTFPGGRHMYMVPTTPVPTGELDGYSGLRFRYRAVLPEGITGLLVMLVENTGSQYVATPPPPASDAWTTVTIPVEGFRKGSWSKDPNNRFDLCDVSKVAFGVHGSATGAGGDGLIMAVDIALVP